MKVLNILLAMYVLFLSGIPCSDNMAGGCMDNKATTESVHNDLVGDCVAADTCNPFCICSYCGSIHTLYSISHIEKLILKSDVSHYFIFENAKLIFAPYSFWHPPKQG